MQLRFATGRKLRLILRHGDDKEQHRNIGTRQLEKLAKEADGHRTAAENAGDTALSGDIEARINEIKRDMFFAKAKVELVLLRDLDKEFVRGEICTIFPSGEGMRAQI